MMNKPLLPRVEFPDAIVPLEVLGGSWAVDLSVLRLTWSAQASALFDVRKSYTPTVWEALEFVDVEDRPQLVSAFLSCVNRSRSFELEFGLTSGKGLRKRARITGFPLSNSAGRLGSVRGIVQRVTPNSDATNVRNEDTLSVVRLTSALRESEALACAVPHELRAPLIVAAGFAKIVMETESAAMSPQGQNYMNRILSATAQMSGVIDDLLALAPLSTTAISRQQVDLSAMAARIFDAMQSTDLGRKVELQIQPGLVAEGDPVLLRQLLQNLFGNAWKFSQKQNPARISFTRARGPHGWVYAVKDNGVGFDIREVQELFTPFARLHSDKDFAGNGIGLTIARRIVELHGGRIWADSSPGAGAAFSFSLHSNN